MVELTYQRMIARGLALPVTSLAWQFEGKPKWLPLSMMMI
jgi:hypothetical protein